MLISIAASPSIANPTYVSKLSDKHNTVTQWNQQYFMSFIVFVPKQDFISDKSSACAHRPRRLSGTDNGGTRDETELKPGGLRRRPSVDYRVEAGPICERPGVGDTSAALVTSLLALLGPLLAPLAALLALAALLPTGPGRFVVVIVVVVGRVGGTSDRLANGAARPGT